MIPDGWTRESLINVAEIRTGVAKGKKNLKDPVSVPYLRVANVQDGRIDLTEIKSIEIERDKLCQYALSDGDVLMTEGGDFDKLGRGDVWRGQISPCINQNHVFAVRVDQNRILPYFLSSLSGSHYGKSYFLGCAKKSTNLASINSTQIKEFPVLIPPVAEQAKIEEILSTWDTAIETTEKLIENSKAQKKALMQQLLTGKKRLPGFSDEWQQPKFDEILDIDIGGTPSRSNKEYWDPKKSTENRWLSIADIKSSEIRDSKEYISDQGVKNSNVTLIPTGTIIMSFKLTIGRKAILRKPCFTNEAICALLIKDQETVDPSFLFHALDAVDFEREIDQAVKGKTLNKRKLQRLKLRLPPLAEQRRISAVLSLADQETTNFVQQLEYFKDEKRSLMQQLLTGKRRVKVAG